MSVKRHRPFIYGEWMALVREGQDQYIPTYIGSPLAQDWRTTRLDSDGRLQKWARCFACSSGFCSSFNRMRRLLGLLSEVPPVSDMERFRFILQVSLRGEWGPLFIGSNEVIRAVKPDCERFLLRHLGFTNLSSMEGGEWGPLFKRFNLWIEWYDRE